MPFFRHKRAVCLYPIYKFIFGPIGRFGTYHNGTKAPGSFSKKNAIIRTAPPLSFTRALDAWRLYDPSRGAGPGDARVSGISPSRNECKYFHSNACRLSFRRSTRTRGAFRIRRHVLKFYGRAIFFREGAREKERESEREWGVGKATDLVYGIGWAPAMCQTSAPWTPVRKRAVTGQ